MTEVLVDSQFTCLTQSHRSRVLPLSPNFFFFRYSGDFLEPHGGNPAIEW